MSAPSNAKVAWAHTFPAGYGFTPPQVLRGPDRELVVFTEVDRLSESEMTPFSDYLLMRFDAETGELIWLQQLESYPKFALDTQGNIILATATSLRKLAPDGKTLWSKPRTPPDAFETMAVDGEDHLILARCEVDMNPGTAGADPKGHIELEKLDADGLTLWSREFGDGTACPGALYVTVDHEQQVVLLAASLDGPFDFGGGPLFDNDVLVKYDSNGNHVFSEALGGYGPVYAQSTSPVQTDAAGNILTRTESIEAVDIGLGPLSCIRYFFKFDPTGVPIWNKCIDADGFAVQADGGFVVESTLRRDEMVGEQQCTVVDRDSDGSEAMLARYDAAGNWLATECSADPSYQFVGNVAPDPSGMFFMTAAFRQQLTLPDGSLAGPLGDEYTALIAKVDVGNSPAQ